MNVWNLIMDLTKGECKMEILNARIEGFRNIERNSIIFSDITSLVSVNSYGKSNFIKAIDFAVDFIKADKEQKEEMMQWTSGIPLNKTIDAKNFVADFEFKYISENKEYIINYGFEFVWIKQEDEGAEITKEWLQMKVNEKNQRYNALINRANGKTTFKSSETGRCSNVLKINNKELAINKLMFNDKLFFNNIIEQINSLNVYIERHLDTTSSYNPNPLVKRGGDEFDLNMIDNIPRVIYSLKKKYPDKYAILEDAYIQLFPTIESIEVEEYDIGGNKKIKLSKKVPYLVSDKVYVLNVEDSNLNQPINFERLSDGAKRVFLMLTYAVLADIKGLSLIAFEEPENSVHPSLLQSYLNVLLQLANNCKIIIASHSPYILQYVNTNDIYIGIPNNKGIADFRRIDEKKIRMIQNDSKDMNDSIGNYIFELLSGAEDDLDILSGYLEK